MTASVTGLAQISLGVSLQLLQDHSADLLGSVLLAVQGHLVVGAHLKRLMEATVFSGLVMA